MVPNHTMTYKMPLPSHATRRSDFLCICHKPGNKAPERVSFTLHSIQGSTGLLGRAQVLLLNGDQQRITDLFTIHGSMFTANNVKMQKTRETVCKAITHYTHQTQGKIFCFLILTKLYNVIFSPSQNSI